MKDKKLTDFLSFNAAIGLRNLAVEFKGKTMATRTNNNRTYYINPAYLAFNENSGYGVNLIQVSASSSCWISVYDKTNGIGYSDADKNYQRWKITAYNNKFPDNAAYRIYVRLDRNGASALIVYSKKVYNVDGSSTDTEASADYYYIYIGDVSATDGTSIRDITYDTGYLESDQGYEDVSELNEMWELDKYSTPWLVKAKQWLHSFTVKGFISLIGGLIFKKGEEEKVILDVKRSMDDDDHVPVNDQTIPTTAYLDARIETIGENYLRKDQDDSTPYSLEVGGTLDVGKKLTAEGEIHSKDIISTEKAIEVGDFVAGASGAIIQVDKVTGQTMAELDKLYVRMKAYFETLEIVNVNAIGGKQILSPAGAVHCYGVEEMEDVYRCYFLGEQDGEVIENRFQEDDQVYSEMFNAKEGVSNKVSNTFYWRLVDNVSDEPVFYNAQQCHYIDLSKSDFWDGSNIPKAGDVINHRGNRSNPDRMNFIEMSAVGTKAPYVTLFQGVDSYSLEGKDYVQFGYDPVTGKAFMNVYGDMYVGARDRSTYMSYTPEEGLVINGKLAVGTKLGDTDLKELIESATPEGYQEFVEKVARDIKGLQQQIDGAVDSYFYQYDPTNDNPPASGWVTEEEKRAHLNDTFTNISKDSGHSWRWTVDDTTGVFSWVEIKDTATSQALAMAGLAKDTADGKRTVFIKEPTVPYYEGDLWAAGEESPLMRCIKERISGSFDAEDWDYADNVEKVKTEMQQLVSGTTESLNKTIEEASKAANEYADKGISGAKDELDKTIDALNLAKANLEDVYTKASADDTIEDVEARALEAAKAEAEAAMNLYDTLIKAYADGTITEEEAKSIAGAKAALDEAKKYAEEQAQEVQDNLDKMESGKDNLLRNSGFFGDYTTAVLTGDVVLEESSEMFSPSLKYWNSLDAEAQESDESESGKEVVIESNGYISQRLFNKLFKGENYVFSFRAKGTGQVAFSIGGYVKNIEITDEWNLYVDKFVTLSTNSILKVEAHGGCTLCELQLERGTVRSAWGMSPLDNRSALAQYESMAYLKSAIEDGSATFQGGLGLANLMFAKDMNGNVTAGMSGITNSEESVSFFSGGDFDKAYYTLATYRDNPVYQPTESELAQMANYVVTHGGRAILNDVILRGYIYALGGLFKGAVDIANGKIKLDSDGSGHFADGNVRWTKEGITYKKAPEYIEWTFVMDQYEEGDSLDLGRGLYIDITDRVGSWYFLPVNFGYNFSVRFRYDPLSRSSDCAMINSAFSLRLRDGIGTASSVSFIKTNSAMEFELNYNMEHNQWEYVGNYRVEDNVGYILKEDNSSSGSGSSNTPVTQGVSKTIYLNTDSARHTFVFQNGLLTNHTQENINNGN